MLTNANNPRGLAVDVESPVVIWSSVAAAVVAAVLHPLLMPNTEPMVSSRAKHIRKLITGYAVLFGVSAALGVLYWSMYGTVLARAAVDPYHPRLGDFPITLFSFAFLTITRIVLTPLFAKLGAALIPRSKFSPEQWHARVHRFAGQSWKIMYHLAATIIPLVILHGLPWWPPGFENRALVWEDYPYTKPTPWLREFYLCQLGYYFHALQLTLIQSSRANFVSMVVHHIATITLVIQSYFIINLVRFGTQIFWLHDVTDVPVCLTRLFVDLPYPLLTAASYVLLMVGWVVFRIIIYPWDCVKAHAYDALANGWVPKGEMNGYWVAIPLESLLAIMHWMWLGELAGMAKTYLKSGHTSDTTDEHHKETPVAKAKQVHHRE